MKGMADDQKDRFIQYLAEQHREDELTRKAMELVLEDFMARQKELDEKMPVLMSEHSSMKAELHEERRLRKAAEREVRSLRERLGQANEERYGERCQRVRKKKPSGETEKPEPDRNDEKDDFDGTEGSLRADSVDAGCPQAAASGHLLLCENNNHIPQRDKHGQASWRLRLGVHRDIFQKYL